MERVMSKKIIVSDLKCCWKYRHTLPANMQLIGDFESIASTISSHSIPEESTPPVLSKMESDEDLLEMSSTRSCVEEETEIDHSLVERAIDAIMREAETAAHDETDSRASSVCSDWIVLKPRKRKKLKIVKHSSVFYLNEPADTSRLLNRPPSPGTEFSGANEKYEWLMTSNALKYKDAHPMWPEPPDLDESLLKRAPSPNMSLPKIREDALEVDGEDWMWIEGRYLHREEGEGLLAGEDGEYYRIAKQWINGRWEPSPHLLEKWEIEESALEKERLKKLEETEQYNRILKREDSPGMDIMNWGAGPEVLTKWKDFLGETSVQELLRLIPEELFRKFLEETSALSLEMRKLLVDNLNAALMDYSTEWIRSILNEHLSKGLAESIGEKIEQEIPGELQGESKFLNDAVVISQSKVFDAEPSSTWDNVAHQPLEVPVSDDIVPQEFRNLLVNFIKQFREDMPDDLLDYAVSYFQLVNPAGGDRVTETTRSPSLSSGNSGRTKSCHIYTRRKSIRTQSIIPESAALSYSQNTFEKSEEEVDTLSKGLSNCFMFNHLGISGYADIIRNMYRMSFSKNEIVVAEGEAACAFYVVETGLFEVSCKRHEKPVKLLKKYDVFGESCLVGETPSPYTVFALEDSVAWCLFGETFRYLSLADGFQRRNNVNYVMNKKVGIYQKLTHEEKQKLLDCTESRLLKRAEVVFRSGDLSDGLYMVLEGAVKLISVCEKFESPSESQVIKIRGPSPLNEEEFINGGPNKLTCLVSSNLAEISVLKTDVFERLIGDVDAVMSRPEPSSPAVVFRWDEEIDEFFGETTEYNYEKLQPREE